MEVKGRIRHSLLQQEDLQLSFLSDQIALCNSIELLAGSTLMQFVCYCIELSRSSWNPKSALMRVMNITKEFSITN